MTNKNNCTAIKSSTGLGKSTMMRKHAGNFIKKLREDGDKRSIVVFVPTRKLAIEQMHECRKEFPSLNVECFIGSANENPDKMNVKMCERHEAKTLIEKGIALSNLCGTDKSEEWCKHHIRSGCDNPCGYSRQNHIHADVWFTTHQKLFTPKPSNITPIAVVIDEAFHDASISNELKLHASELTEIFISSEYEKACEIIMPYLSNANDGGLDVHHIRSTSNHALEACYKAVDELKNYRSNKISPSMTSHEVKQALERIPSISLITFWRVLAVALKSKAINTPYIKKVTNKNNESSFHIIEKRNIHKDWNTDTLLLDATLSAGITKLYFGKMDTHVIECPMSATTVTQISDMSLSKGMMLPDKRRGDKKNAELIKNLDKLISILNVKLASISKGVKVDGYSHSIKILLVTNKAIEEKLKEHENFPEGIATMHYGATSGIDIYKDVPSLVIAGRLMLPVRDSERLGSLHKGEVISEGNCESWYPQRHQAIVTESSEEIIESDYHTDPIAEEVRYSKTEAELIQAIGRVRAIRRDDTKPLDILILTNVPLPLKVDLLTTWNEVVPTKLEMLLANEKISPLSYNELERLYPNTYRSNKTARIAVDKFYKRYPVIKDIVKSNLSAFLPIYSINREKGTQFQHYKELRLVRYKRKSKGAKPCFALIFDIEADEIEEALSLVVGELKSYQYICAFSTNGEALP